MSKKTIRDIERQANIEAGTESAYTGGPNATPNVMQDVDLSYADIAWALANRYDSIYYVNLSNNHYVEYTSSAEYQGLTVELSGEDFFGDSARNIRRVVYPEDQAFALMMHQKGYLLSELDKNGIVSVTYRIMFDDKPHFYNGRFTRGTGDGHDYLIVGWADVDSEVKRERSFDERQGEQQLMRDISRALTSDYVKVFYIDLSDDSYCELTPDPKTGDLMVTMTGRDFFFDIQQMVRGAIYHADLGRVTASMRRDNMLELMTDAPFIITYRKLERGKAVWHTLKALYSKDRSHVLIAIRDIDIQKRRETDYEYKIHSMSQLVNRDVMTGVKNKNAFTQEESKWDQLIADTDGVANFAIAVCDVNDLKAINDSKGHMAGDQAIIEAAGIISRIFKHSPVFRIGGDEFAVVLSQRDYTRRSALMGELEDRMRDNANSGRVVMAHGIAAYDVRVDTSFSDVFQRADHNMYEQKKRMKETWSASAMDAFPFHPSDYDPRG